MQAPIVCVKVADISNCDINWRQSILIINSWTFASDCRKACRSPWMVVFVVVGIEKAPGDMSPSPLCQMWNLHCLLCSCVKAQHSQSGPLVREMFHMAWRLPPLGGCVGSATSTREETVQRGQPVLRCHRGFLWLTMEVPLLFMRLRPGANTASFYFQVASWDLFLSFSLSFASLLIPPLPWGRAHEVLGSGGRMFYSLCINSTNPSHSPSLHMAFRAEASEEHIFCPKPPRGQTQQGHNGFIWV